MKRVNLSLLNLFVVECLFIQPAFEVFKCTSSLLEIGIKANGSGRGFTFYCFPWLRNIVSSWCRGINCEPLCSSLVTHVRNMFSFWSIVIFLFRNRFCVFLYYVLTLFIRFHFARRQMNFHRYFMRKLRVQLAEWNCRALFMSVTRFTRRS